MATATGYAQFELGERPLTVGSWGADVFRLQQELSRIGYKIRSDGHFGKETERAVIAFQIANGLDPDGIAGQRTLAKIAAVRPFLVYTVQAGDTLWELAEAYDTSMEELVLLNRLPDGPLKVGAVLQIPIRQTYTVRPGDTLSAIAFRYGTTVKALVDLNQIPDPNRIRAGSLLRLPWGAEPTSPGF